MAVGPSLEHSFHTCILSPTDLKNRTDHDDISILDLSTMRQRLQSQHYRTRLDLEAIVQMSDDGGKRSDLGGLYFFNNHPE